VNPVKRQHISELAESLRRSLKLGVPVNVDVAVGRLEGNIADSAALPEGVSAQIRKVGNSFTIAIDRNSNRNRRRFSIAHELGHLFLHMGFLIDPSKWERTREFEDSVYSRFGFSLEESEANEFAACFLMPSEDYLRALMRTSGRVEARVNFVAKQFEVSPKSALWRGINLGVLEKQ
jgi:Zn-dependent peptidase ImmA (M78 family)